MIMNRDTIFNDLFRDITRFSIGFEPLFNRFESYRTTLDKGYPPYNLEKVDNNTSRLTLAVAGFSKDDIAISLFDKVLTIVGDTRPRINDGDIEPNHEISPETNYIHKGISNRRFLRDFIIGDNTVITRCNLKDGLLTIDFLTSIPNEQPKVLKITTD